MDLGRELDALRARGRYRSLRVLAGGARPWLEHQGRRYLNLSSSNYLGLADHPRVIAAAVASLYDEGLNAAGSCLITGHGPAHAALEAAIAQHQGTEASVVFAAGYQTNLGVVTALAGPDTVLFCDALNHASLIDAARLSRARVVVWRHRDVDHLRQCLNEVSAPGGRLIVTDGVFSMDGDVAPLPELTEVAEAHGALLVVDDAHGLGVLGKTGAGLAEYFGLRGRIPVAVATLSKAVGAQGGFVAGSATLVDYLVNRARSFIFSSGLVAPVARAAAAALEVIQDEPERRQRLGAYARRLRRALADQGWQVVPTAVEEVPIVAVVVGSEGAALSLMEQLRQAGIWAAAIRPPSVPEGTSRLRLTVTADHRPEEIDWVIAEFWRIRQQWREAQDGGGA
ncbi:MAG: 8-amino-7-oxononanoate synthase [Firmicutes bacterium]|nr:8-amino-7-oxononanoate synthase [Alicyclobacillaceae bacterium]MCL6496520.1 8-amino-7-oxononanoate synthase [Bacillota bacterium]